MRRIIFLIAIFLLTLSPMMGQIAPITLPADGDWPTIVGDSIMLIGPKQEALTEEQRYFNPPYLLVYPGKEHLKEQMIRAALCDCDTNQPNRRIGVFSVAKDKQVSFSQGNLQYLPASNVWKFASQQYEYLHNSNKYISPTYRNWIDLFGWSSDNSLTPFGISTSTNPADYAGNFVDWGNNPICGDEPGTWRTLSADEWEYLLEKRANAAQLYGVAKVDGVNGLIILPDAWVCPEGLSFKHGLHQVQVDDYAVYQSFDAEAWKRMEDAGAVFLSASGFRDGITVEKSNLSGYYWSSTSVSQSDAYRMYFYSYFLGAKNTHSKYRGRSVRLVHDTIVPPPTPCQTITVNGVTFNMMCVEGGTFMMGEGRTDAHQVTLSDYYIGETEVTQAQWKAIMGNVPTGLANYGDTYPVANISLADCRLFVERLSELTGRHFRIPTEAEWEYAARGGKHSKGFAYAGSDDIEEVAWYKGNKTEHKPKPVKCFKPNELGIYDMSGNMGEWVSDWYAPYNTYPQINPTGAAVHSTPGWPYTYRGGAWGSDANNCTPTSRQSHQRATYAIGLRIVMSDEEPFRAVYINDTTRFYLRPVKKGTFMMGSREDDPIIQQRPAAKADELPQRKVTLDSDYWVAEYELTQAIWTAVMGTDVYNMHAALTKPTSDVVVAGPGYPMYFVYTKDVFEFTRRLSKMTGLNFRLPTEAEWEYAARGGNLSHGYLYAGSNDPDSVAWYHKGTTTDVQTVGQKVPNELGIYDMSGNVLERCVDYLEYHQPYDPNDTINPRGKLKQSGNRAYRGGAYNMHKDSVRVTHRAPQTPTFTSKNVGTRLVVNDEHHFQTFNVGSVWFDMIFVKGGTFQMGCTTEMEAEAYAHEAPVHQVTLSDYYIGQIEVTQRLWQTVMGSNPSTIKDTNSPVNNVSWEDCQAFIAKLNQLTGHNFRLPTEAEWEYAARGGHKSQGYKYAGSNNIDEVAWYSGNSGGSFKNFAKKLPNELGIYDMSGNVWEWCQDWYGPYTADAQVNPQGPTTGKHRMYRGGGWKHTTSSRVAYRRVTMEGWDKTSLGLRLALDTAQYVPVPSEPGKRIGVFSVANDKQVSFSQGNLQYNRQRDKWYFASNQYEYLGEDNIKDGQLANRIDLFGWSSDSGKAPWGVSTSTSPADYSGNFVDWGTNTIQGDKANTWRTLSVDEWEYLIQGRKNAANLIGVAQVNGINGLIILPDDWVCPEGVNFVSGFATNEGIEYYKDVNTYSLEQWKLLEAAGSVFLPAAGRRSGQSILNLSRFGNYWSSTPKNNDYIHYLAYTSATNYVDAIEPLHVGRAVRLVHDTIVPPPAPCKTIEVGGVSFNMMCVDGDKYDYLIGQTEVTRALWKAVMGKLPNGSTATDVPVDNVTWGDCQEFITQLNSLTGLHFRFPTKDEWLYAAKGGQYEEDFLYSGSDNIDKVGWYDGNTPGGVQPVAQLKPNALGIYDMTGNVWEWVLQTSNSAHLYMGGSYAFNATSCLLGNKGTATSPDHEGSIGLRLVLDTHQYVDLGLSVMWATTNVGAEEPEEYGEYFAWGETEPKDNFTWANYKWCDGTVNNITKYNNIDSLITLLPEDDAAHVNWGGEWRMPTFEEQRELREYCTWTWETINGHTGYRVTGPNGNSIFLPAAGNITNQKLDAVGAMGYQWSSTAKPGIQAHRMHYSHSVIEDYHGGSRACGASVRPVIPTGREPLPAPCQTITVNGVSFNMMCVEGGTFTMGATEEQLPYAQANEKPAHQVTLSDYMIAQTEVTQELWTAVMGTTLKEHYESHPKEGTDLSGEGDLYPMYKINKEDCLAFIAKLNQLTGLHFRLPTEAEWEYAARGGKYSRGYIYPGGDDLHELAWYKDNSDNKVHPVATKKPNELGIYDMAGNVWEYVSDWYGPYTADAQVNPLGPVSGTQVILRGGSRANSFGATNCRVSARLNYASVRSHVGLRLVLDTHQYVDLGLSVLWATTNVGAEDPEQYGDYYAWGETETKDFYGWSTYKWCDGTENTLTKYCTNPKLGVDSFTDGLTTLLPEDDAAHVHWGAMWRMATKSEFQELINNCSWETTTLNGVKGYRVTSTIPGYTDRSIFLPLAGYHNHDLGASNVGTSVRYWSSSGSNTSASDLYMATLEGNTRRIGMTIRPVLPTHRKIITPKAEPGKRIGLFSVGKGKHVTFSQGNLMYLTLKKQWLFAPNQLYYTGNRHLQNGQIADTVMYFGWSAKDSKAPWGISTSINLDHYKGEFLDWGTNTIQGDKPNTWRTMTDEEVLYLFEGRPNAKQLIGFAEVEGINGMILLPDDWQLPEGLSFTPYDATTVNHYTQAQWQQMEDAGAVIIPAAGYFNNKLSLKMREVGEVSFLPYSVLIDSIHQQYSYLRHDKMLQRWPGNNTGNLFYAFPRRLVRDTVVPEYVDMGLSVKWANYNLGASTPTGVGDYYAWGETEPKDSYMPANYQWSMGSAKTYTKYCTVDSMGYNGFTDGLTTLQPQDDAAQMQKGGHWRMPSDAEWEELIRNCTWTQAEQGGQIGYIATSKINGNSIFIPVAGFRSVGNVVLDYLGAYWSSSLNESKQSCAYGLYINKDEDRVGRYSNSCREYGFLIRPVYDENYHAYVDLGLSVKWATTNVGAETPEQYGDYFAWGETEPKEVYDWSTYKWCDRTENNMTKYNATDGLTTLLPEDDAATVNWGGEWRMPTKEELAELRLSCTWEPATINGVKGAKVTGPNGNSIFIPLGGSYNTFNDQLNSVGSHGWIYSATKASVDNQAKEMGVSSSGAAQTSCSRCLGLNIRPVIPKPDDGKVTVTIVPTQSDATVSLLCIGYTREGNSITVDKGKSVLYLVSNVADRYLSQGDSLLNLTRDTTLYVTLEPFSDGVWETVDDSLLEYTPDCYISRNYCSFAQYDSWSYYVMLATEGETYRIQTIAGQHAAPWIAVSTLPDFATLTRATKIACSPIKGPAGYLAEEFTVPAGTKYLIFNHRTSSTYPLKVEKKSKYRYGISSQYWEECNGLWGHGGRGHAVQDQSPIQGTIVQGVRLNVGREGSLNIYKIPSLFESTEDNFQLVATITTDSPGLQDIDFPTPIYVGENEYLVFGKPSEITPTLTPMYNTLKYDTFKQFFVHFIGTDKVKKAGSALMVDFY